MVPNTCILTSTTLPPGKFLRTPKLEDCHQQRLLNALLAHTINRCLLALHGFGLWQRGFYWNCTLHWAMLCHARAHSSFIFMAQMLLENYSPYYLLPFMTICRRNFYSMLTKLGVFQSANLNMGNHLMAVFASLFWQLENSKPNVGLTSGNYAGSFDMCLCVLIICGFTVLFYSCFFISPVS